MTIQQNEVVLEGDNAKFTVGMTKILVLLDGTGNVGDDLWN
jgi:hypothetical protein